MSEYIELKCPIHCERGQQIRREFEGKLNSQGVMSRGCVCCQWIWKHKSDGVLLYRWTWEEADD